MSGFEITHNIDPFANGMKRAPGIIREEFLRSTDRLTLQGEGMAKGIVRVKTGHLRRSIAMKPAVWAGGATGSFGTATPYAKYVEFGRGPVHARPGGYLRFTIGGRTIYAKSVGPAAARPFMRPTLARLRPLVPREYRAAMQRVMARIGGA